MVNAVSGASPTSQTNKAIYDNSSLENICDLYLPTAIDDQVRSVACLVENKNLVKNKQTGFYDFPSVQTLSQRLWPLDASTKFSSELTLGKGTAFLVGNKLMLTAAHCLLDSVSKIIDVTTLCAVFDYSMQTANTLAPISDTSVCKIAQIKALKHEAKGEDWALVELYTHPVGRKPLRIDFTNYIAQPIPIYMLGHPFGLPIKYVEGTVIPPARDVGTFDAKITSFSGNSGSPIFNSTTKKVIGILVRGNKSVDSSGLNKGIPNKLHIATAEEIYNLGYEKAQRTTCLAKYIVSLIDQNDGYYKKEAEKTYELGDRFYFGKNVVQDYNSAVSLYKQTIELDPTHAQALCDLGHCYEYHEIDGKYDPIRAYDFYKQAIAITPHFKYHAKALYYVGTCHHYGVNVEKDANKAIGYYKEALKVDPTYIDALELLAVCYFEGEGAQNFKEAFIIFNQLASSGHVRAMYYLGECYYHGKGVTKDVKKALMMSRKANDLGFAVTAGWVSIEEDKAHIRWICSKIMSLFLRT